MADKPEPQGVQHCFMHGLCFDSMWDYQTRSRSGRKSWARLDLGSAAYPWAQEDDPHGAGWCVRCCASVLGQRPVPLTHMQKSPVPAGDHASVAAALRELLPKFEIDVQLDPCLDLVHRVAQTLKDGGGVLAYLERGHALRQIPPCWVWVVGVEAKPVSLCLSCNQARSLLLVGPELQPAWACGYGAKATLTGEGDWIVRSVDGQTWTGLINPMICLRPK